MDEILHANIFFIIASIGVVLFTVLLSLALYQVVKILRLVRRIVERVEVGSEVLADDIDNLRTSFNPARLFNFILGFIPMNMSQKKKDAEAED